MTPYTQIQIRRMIQKWLEWRPTPLFIFILPTFILYDIHLPWHADMDINLFDYGCKEINITYIWDAWLRPYYWISPHDHPDGSIDLDSQGPQKWPLLVLLQNVLYPGAHFGCHYSWWICCCVFLEGWESWGVLGLNIECLDIVGGWC